MKKNTLDDIENDYKEAIRTKYRKERIEGKHSHYLNNPSQALLRDLCWEIFNSSPKVDDIVVYRNFFKAEFVPNDENNSTTYTDKFKKVGAFLKGGKEPAKISTVELAAILVDFEPRPFKKFIKEGINEEPGDDNPKETTVSGGLKVEKKDEDLLQEEPKNEEIEAFQPTTKPVRINLFVNAKERILYNFKNRLKKTAAATIVIFGLIGIVIYFAFFKNHCMQWSEDHYEVVDCSSKDNGNFNEIIPLDEDLLDFRKLKACDTTTCFMKNGEAFVWYGKTANGIDFFNDNGNGRHPETKGSLRPVTHYIFGKYLKGKPCQ